MKPEQIKALRLKLKMTQTIFAACVHSTQGTVSCWELGKHSPHPANVEILNDLAEEHPDPLRDPTQREILCPQPLNDLMIERFGADWQSRADCASALFLCNYIDNAAQTIVQGIASVTS